MSSRSNHLGISLMTATWSIYALMSALAKQTYIYAPPSVSFFFQNAVALVIIAPFLLKDGLGALKSSRPALLFWRGAGGAASFYCFFYALGSLPLTDCTLLNCTSPLFVPFILLIVWKRTSSLQIWGSLLLGFLGILIVFPPESQSVNVSSMVGLLGGLGTALTMFVIRALAEEPYLRVMFYYFLIASLASLPFAAPYFETIPGFLWPLYGSIGLLFVLAQIAYTLSLRWACPSLSAPFMYTFILSAILIDCIVERTFPSLHHSAGICLVMAGGGMILYNLKKRTERDSNP